MNESLTAVSAAFDMDVSDTELLDVRLWLEPVQVEVCRLSSARPGLLFIQRGA